ncbi:MAG TPA: DUF3558 family protein [Actinophytocola sp.]|jgi:hypothetical protein|nr:DUF3558 family protein [Actinophytocola sp.]
MLRRFAPAVTVALLLAGCGGNPAPTTTPPTEDTRATTSPPAGPAPRPTTAPPIADPLDLGPGYRYPCAALTAGQQNRLGLRPRVAETADGSVGRCHWAKKDANHHYDYVLQLHVRSDALTDAYQNSNSRDADGDPTWAVFEPREIRGLPAVVHASSARGDTCEVVVGVGPGQGVVLTGNTDPDPALCDRLVTAAGLVVDTVRRWAGV